MLNWTLKHARVDLGYIPLIITDEDPRPAAEQIEDRYSHGGGWSPLAGFAMLPDGRVQYCVEEDLDPPLEILAETKLRNETIRFYQSSWIAIIQPDGSFAVSRLD